MSSRPCTSDGRPIAGWVLRADPGGFDVAAVFATYGQVFRFPLPESERAELLAPGQACYLYSGERSRQVGIWGAGEVVAPVLELDDQAAAAAGAALLAEVEILALAKPIARAKLARDPVLARGELLSDGARPNPVVLRAEELRALEAFDFELVEPSEAQRALVEAALDDEAG